MASEDDLGTHCIQCEFLKLFSTKYWEIPCVDLICKSPEPCGMMVKCWGRATTDMFQSHDAGLLARDRLLGGSNVPENGLEG